MQEETIILAEQHLLHYVEAFDDVQQVDNVEVSAQLLYALVQVKVFLARLAILQARALAIAAASEAVQDCQTGIVCESPLIKNQVEDVVELLFFRGIADQVLSLLA